MNDRFAQSPLPPYYAVIFTNQRTVGDKGYEAMGKAMAELALNQPGCLGIESSRDDAGFGITVSYWKDEASIAAWKAHAEHATARALGNSTWYAHYELRVARVERAYSGPR
jgi:heme-degrading monooxygenase HmoA